MAQLLLRGFVAALAPAGVPTADIVVTDPQGHMTAAVQVKTRKSEGGDQGWHMSQKHEGIIGPKLFYVFCNLAPNPATCYILPSAIVADVLKRDHAKWLATPGRNGKAHNDTPMRRLKPSYPSIGLEEGWLDPYRDNWDLLRG